MQVFGLAPLLFSPPYAVSIFLFVKRYVLIALLIDWYLLDIFCMECIAFQYVSSKSYLSSCRCCNGRWPREGGRPKKTALNVLLFPKCSSFCSAGVGQSLPLVTVCHNTYLFISEIYITTFFAHINNEKTKRTKSERKKLTGWCLSPPPTLTIFFLRSFLGADICLLRTLQGIWTNGFVISTFLPPLFVSSLCYELFCTDSPPSLFPVFSCPLLKPIGVLLSLQTPRVW